jgi:cytochrome b6-f complex iron-sulfur subunit
MNRRQFFRFSFLALSAGTAIAMGKALKQSRDFKASSQSIKIDLVGPPLELLSELIIVRGKESIKAYSRRCTHLGCALQAEADSYLVCPCHGSAFDLEGNLMKGPARKPLQELELIVDAVNGIVTVYPEGLV